jgi:hypothetical protein
VAAFDSSALQVDHELPAVDQGEAETLRVSLPPLDDGV